MYQKEDQSGTLTSLLIQKWNLITGLNPKLYILIKMHFEGNVRVLKFLKIEETSYLSVGMLLNAIVTYRKEFALCTLSNYTQIGLEFIGQT